MKYNFLPKKFQAEIDTAKLENVKRLPDGSIRARCPACAAADSDKSGEHLLIKPDGKYGCAAHPKDREHRREIFRLAGKRTPIHSANSNGSLADIAETYDYQDRNSKLLFQVCRFDPKDFRQRKPDGKGGWIWNTKCVEKVLFRLPEIIRDSARGLPIFICEGEKDVLEMVKHGFSASCNPGGAGKWQDSFSQTLRGADVAIIADKDKAGREHAQLVASKLHGAAKSVKVIELPDLNGKPVKDAFDFFAAGGDAGQIQDMVDSAPEWAPASVPEETPPQIEAVKPKPILQGCPILLPEIELWPEAVNGAETLSKIAESFVRYVALPDGAADALALWVAHTHVFTAFLCSPRLNICSPEKRCGKTTLRDVIAVFVPRPLLMENLSVAVLFRLVNAHAPTILADEYDAWLNDNEELRGLLNSGHRHGGLAFRCVGDNNEVRGFQVFAPAVLCGIGALPGTLHDRSIVIGLKRAKSGELRERFDSRRLEREKELCRKLARFAADNAARLETFDPVLPFGAFNRLADNWRPLFAIAQIAGGDWPQRATAAFAKLNSQDDADAQGLGVMLLADIQQAFNENHAERIFSKSLVEALCAMTDRPWPEAHKGKSITETWLARRLHSFGITSRTLRIGDNRAKGYELADFNEIFERYLPVVEKTKRDIVTMPENVDVFEFPKRDNKSECHASENQKTIESIGLSRCHDVNPPAGEARTGKNERPMP